MKLFAPARDARNPDQTAARLPCSARLHASDGEPNVALRFHNDGPLECLVDNGTLAVVLDVSGDYARIRVAGRDEMHVVKRWHLPGFATSRVPSLVSLEIEPGKVSSDHPVAFTHPNKQAAFEHASAGTAIPGAPTMRYTRWNSGILPPVVPCTVPVYEPREGFFDYAAASGSEVHWYPNFAHEQLFVAWDSDLLAQDELQVLEHPALASIQMMLRADPDLKNHAWTREGRRPTPVLLQNVPRRLVIDTKPSAECPQGLYGNAFAKARKESCAGATTKLDPPTFTNLYCIEAPPSGHGKYRQLVLQEILQAAYAAFAACCEQSEGNEVVVHVGYWGCGAYGGNTTVMAALQLLAARLAGVDRVVFTLAREGITPYENACRLLEEVAVNRKSVDDIINTIRKRGFEWGIGSGE